MIDGDDGDDLICNGINLKAEVVDLKCKQGFDFDL